MEIRQQMLSVCAEIENQISFYRGKGVCSPTFDQIKRSSTAIGANYCEAMGCHTDKDFRKTVGIALKECNETMWWVDVIHNDLGFDKYDYITHTLVEIKEALESQILDSLENCYVPTEWGKTLEGVLTNA